MNEMRRTEGTERTYGTNGADRAKGTIVHPARPYFRDAELVGMELVRVLNVPRGIRDERGRVVLTMTAPTHWRHEVRMTWRGLGHVKWTTSYQPGRRE